MSAEDEGHRDAADAPQAASATPAESARAHALRVLDWAEVAASLARECSSAAASRAASELQPSLSLEQARHSFAETEEARGLMAEDGLAVGGVRDIASHLALASRGGRLEPGELSAVAATVTALDEIAGFLVAHAGVAPLLATRAAEISRLPELARAVTRAINEHGHVRDDASPRLKELYRRRASLSRTVEARLDNLRRDPDVAAALTDDFVTVRDDRHVLPVRADRRLRVPGILHGRSGSGQSVFIEPAELVELNNELRGVGLDVEEEIERILRELSGLVARHAPELSVSLRAHCDIDLASARARLAMRLGACVPVTSPDASLEMRSLAHPGLILLRGGASSAAAAGIVRNDVIIDLPALGLVISGPNTGGKTVLLKAVGLACLMARAGLHVAAAPGSSVPFVETVLADIGDEQSIERSLSSFSGHVGVLRDILAACDEAKGSALVLLDEIMAGTDPAEGAPLAEAILDEIAQRGARVIVTTHLGTLKVFAASSERFVNAGMEFDEVTLRPTWRVRLGVPGASAALRMAERLGLPHGLVERARHLAGSQQASVEKLLRDLEIARGEAERARDAARRIEFHAERRRAEYERKLAELTSKDEVFVREERARFEREVKVLRELAADVTRQLQQSPTLATSAEAIRRLDDLKERSRVETARASRSSPGGASPGDATDVGGRPRPSLLPGTRVKSVSMDRVGSVIDPPDARGRVKVAFGSISMSVSSEDLEDAVGASDPDRGAGKTERRAARAKLEAQAADAEAPSAASEIPFTPQSTRNTLDLRGKRVDESISDLSGFLESARAAGERSVVLIHGHGTGALKAAIRDELKSETRVAAFRAGGNGEGGDGVTIALLA